MMIDDNGTIVFTSTPYYFGVEQRGLKPNTVRLLTYGQKRQVQPEGECDLSFPTVGSYYIKKIRIVCTDERLEAYPPFERVLTSIEQIGEMCGHYLFVFSWKHEGDVK